MNECFNDCPICGTPLIKELDEYYDPDEYENIIYLKCPNKCYHISINECKEFEQYYDANPIIVMDTIEVNNNFIVRACRSYYNTSIILESEPGDIKWVDLAAIIPIEDLFNINKMKTYILFS